MHAFFYLLFLSVISPAMIPAAGASGRAGLSDDFPSRDTPQKLVEAWLRFHEEDLCLGVDAVFVFNKRGMEVWCLVEDERSYQKLLELFEPLRDAYRIELYATRPPEEKKSDEEKDPPASVWENYELRSYLGDPFARAKERLGVDTPTPTEMDYPYDPSFADTLKQRLLVYALQTLEWNQKMKRYAMDLPSLARVAFDTHASPALRLQASAACAAHAQNLGKNLSRLETNITQALPRSAKRARASSRSEKSGKAGKAPVENADQISLTAQNVARRVYHFIHPEHYTVGLDELRQPSLPDALRALQGMVLDFQDALTKPARK